MGLASRERAALVKACAVLGGMLASSIRTVARRLQGKAPKVRAQIGVSRVCVDDALLYPGVGDERINHEIPVNRRDKRLADRGG